MKPRAAGQKNANENARSDSPRLIVNADDFGLSRGITDGALTAYNQGILTSVSVMANQPASEYALDLLRDTPGLGAGIHLNLCTGRPVLDPQNVPTLVGADGAFHASALMLSKLWRFQVSAAEITAEFRAQIRWMKNRGITPLHADSHLHAHLYPAAVRPFALALAAEGIRAMRAPRCTAWPRDGAWGGPHEGGFARRILVQSYRRGLQHTIFRTFAMPHSRVSFLSGHRHDVSSIGSSWIATLDHLPPGIFELACHPGLRDHGFSDFDRISEQREEELRQLTSAKVSEAIARNGIELIRYDDILETRATPHAATELPAT